LGPCLSPHVAGRPLRPATDHRPGRPLPHQLANRPQAPPQAVRRPFHTHPTSKRAHAELPSVSEGYPPPQDRLPTCSSPVRHVSTRRHPVRLACIRHAASVDPEPGSNSPPCTNLFPKRHGSWSPVSRSPVPTPSAEVFGLFCSVSSALTDAKRSCPTRLPTCSQLAHLMIQSLPPSLQIPSQANNPANGDPELLVTPSSAHERPLKKDRVLPCLAPGYRAAERVTPRLPICGSYSIEAPFAIAWKPDSGVRCSRG
jgi:hypothetical protein